MSCLMSHNPLRLLCLLEDAAGISSFFLFFSILLNEKLCSIRGALSSLHWTWIWIAKSGNELTDGSFVIHALCQRVGMWFRCIRVLAGNLKTVCPC